MKLNKFWAISMLGTTLIGASIASTLVGQADYSNLIQSAHTKNSKEVVVTTSQQFIDALNNNDDITLGSDIDFDGFEITNQIDSYSGTIDGSDHKIINLNKNYSSNSWGIYFINQFSGNLQNITFKNSYFFAKTISSSNINEVVFFDTQVDDDYNFNSVVGSDKNINFGIFASDIIDSSITNFTFNNNYINSVVYQTTRNYSQKIDFNIGLMAGRVTNTIFDNVVFDSNGVMDLLLQTESLTSGHSILNLGTIAGKSIDSTYEDVILARTMWMNDAIYSNEINFGNYIGALESSDSIAFNSINRTYNAGIAYSNILISERQNGRYVLGTANTSFGVVGNSEISNFVESKPQYKWSFLGELDSYFSSSDLSSATLSNVYSASVTGNAGAPIDELKYSDLNTAFWKNLFELDSNNISDFWNSNYLVRPVDFGPNDTPSANLINDTYGFPWRVETIVLTSIIDFQDSEDETTSDVFNFNFAISDSNGSNDILDIFSTVKITAHSIFDQTSDGFVIYDGTNGGLNPLLDFELPYDAFLTVSRFLSIINDWFWLDIENVPTTLTPYVLINSSQITNTTPLTYNAPTYTLDSVYDNTDPNLPTITFSIKNNLDDGTNTESQIIRGSEKLKLGIPLLGINGTGLSDPVSQSLITNSATWTYNLPEWINSVNVLNQWYYFLEDSLTFKYIGQDKTIQQGTITISPTSSLQSITETEITDSSVAIDVAFDDETNSFEIVVDLVDPSNRFLINENSNIEVSIQSEFNAFTNDLGEKTNSTIIEFTQLDFTANEAGGYSASKTIATTYEGVVEGIPLFFAVNVTSNLDYIANAENVETFTAFSLTGDTINSSLLNPIYDQNAEFKSILTSSYNQYTNEITIDISEVPDAFRYLHDFSISLDIHDAKSIISTITLQRNGTEINVVLPESIKTVLDENSTYSINDFIYFTISESIPSFVEYYDINGSIAQKNISGENITLEGDITNPINSTQDEIYDADEIIAGGFIDKPVEEEVDYYIVVTFSFVILFFIVLMAILYAYVWYRYSYLEN